jgi:hypothetical protein
MPSIRLNAPASSPIPSAKVSTIAPDSQNGRLPEQPQREPGILNAKIAKTAKTVYLCDLRGLRVLVAHHSVAPVERAIVPRNQRRCLHLAVSRANLIGL